MGKRKIKIYLDTSVYNRPFDDQSQSRIRLETEAFLSIMEKVLVGDLVIISSSALAYENSKSPFNDRKKQVATYLFMAEKYVRLNESVKKRAVSLENFGFDPIDALHLAFAEAGSARYFLTCDDGIIKKAKRKGVLDIEVCGLLEFILKEVFKDA